MGINFSVTGSTIIGYEGPVVTTRTRVYIWYLPIYKMSTRQLNPVSNSVALIEKPVNWSAVQFMSAFVIVFN